MPDADGLATLREVSTYFRREGEGLSAFSAEWKQLTEEDRLQLRRGIGDGTFDY